MPAASTVIRSSCCSALSPAFSSHPAFVMIPEKSFCPHSSSFATAGSPA